MTQIPERQRLPLLLAVAVGVVMVVVGMVVVLPGLVPGPRPTPSASGSATPSAPVTSTPEGATRGFFQAYADARRSGDPSPVRSLVTSDTSSAYLTVDGFLRGQKEAGKASVTTVLELNDVRSEIGNDRAMVSLSLTQGGYDIDLDTGQALESPTILPARKVTVQLHKVGDVWLVDSFEATQ